MQYILAIFIITLCTINFKARAQDLVSDISTPVASFNSEDLFTENIQIISKSRKIFILTNSNQMMHKGDFVTLVLDFNLPVARALVAKNHDGLVGIKILKIYSLKNWSRIRQGMDIQILRGDDSGLFAPRQQVSDEPQEQIRIESAEDLFNEKDLLGGDLDSFGKDNRHIKPDNLVSLFGSQYRVENTATDGSIKTGITMGGTWAYQFQDNWWVEGLYARTMLNDFPVKAKQTLINNFSIRIKYTFKLPLYSYAMPYIGYHNYMISSPDAGSENDPIQDAAEVELIQSMSKRSVHGGVTLLRRLVPGWFVKVELGSDILAAGFAIEF